MNLIKKEITSIKNNYAKAHYPKLTDRNKVNVLYISPYNNAVGLYRSIIPAMEMNKTNTHAALVTNVEDFTLQKQAFGFETGINEKTIAWADYIVFPTIFSLIQDDIEMFRKENKKSTLQIGMDVDDNYFFDMPGVNAELAEEMRFRLLINMSMVDFVICENNNLVELYTTKLQEKEFTLPQFHVMPNLMSNDCYLNEQQELIPQISQPSESIRIGMSFNPTQFYDVNPFRNVLMEINRKYKQKVELFVFGWNGKVVEKSSFKDCLRMVNYTHIKQVPVADYFETLLNLRLDFALMPLKDNEFNHCKSYHKLLQYSQINIPAICSQVQPYTNVILAEETANMPEDMVTKIKAKTVVHNNDWMQHVDNYIENKDTLLTEIALYNNLSVQKNYTWHTNCNHFSTIFKK